MPCLRSSRSRKFLMKPSSLRSSAMRTLSREAGMSTFSCSARLALRIRVSMSAMGSLRMAYQLAFTMPGTSPLSASSRKHSRHISNFRRYARGRPHSLHRWYARVENFGVRCDFMMRAVFAIRLLLPERHAEVRQECLRVLVRPRRRDDDDVHPANLVDLVVHDLREDQLLSEAERVVAPAVEPLRGHALEVADARQRDVDEPVEELGHPRPPQRHLRADRHALAQLEVRDRLLRARDDGLLTRDRLELGRGEVEHLRVLASLAHAHIDDDLLQARHLPRVRVAARLHQRRKERLVERLLEPRGDRAGALRAPLRDRGGLGRALALLSLGLVPGRLGRRLRLRRRLRCVLGGVLGHVLTLVDRLAAPSAHAELAAVGERLDARAHGLVAPAAHEQHVRERERALAFDDAALPQLLRGPLVLLDHVHLLDEHPPVGEQHAQHLAPLAPLLAGDHRARVAPSHVRVGHQSTSGASEMIFVNLRSRSSRATGPKMRVPTGFSSGLINTTAFRSKRMYEPSLRRTSFTVRTTTARATSPFFTVPSGAASFTATITVSPSEA